MRVHSRGTPQPNCVRSIRALIAHYSRMTVRNSSNSDLDKIQGEKKNETIAHTYTCAHTYAQNNHNKIEMTEGEIRTDLIT